MKRNVVLLIASLFFSFAIISNINAGTSYTWSAGAAGNWNTTTNWTPNTGQYPGQDTTDTVTFDATSGQNCSINVVVTVASITITSGYTGKVTLSQDVTVTGNFSVDGTRASDGSNPAYDGNTGKVLNVGGNFTGTGTSSVKVNLGTVNLTGTGTFTSTGLYQTAVLNLSVASSGNTTTLSSASVTIYNMLTLGSGSLDMSGNKTIWLGGNIQASGGAGVPITTTIIGDGKIYLNSSSKTIPGGNYPNIVYANTGTGYTITLSGDIVLNGSTKSLQITTSGTTLTTNNYNVTCGSVTISSGTILNAGSSILTLSGTWSNSGTFNYGTSKVVFTGNNTLGANTFYDLTISGGTTTLSGNVTVLNDLTIGAGATLNPAGYTISVGRDINNAGTLTISNLTITGNITNTGTLNITGTSVALNGNITNSGILNTGTMTIPSGKTILLNPGSVWNVNSGSTITINGTLRSSGTTSGLTTIQSNSTSGYFGLTINGSADLTGCKLYYLNTDGLKFSSSGTITKIDNVDFKYGQTDGTHLQVLNGQTITITNVAFDDITNGTNITVKNNTKLKVVKYTIGRFRDSIEAGSSIDYGVDARIDPGIGGKIADNGDANTYVEIPKGAIKQPLTFTLSKIYSAELPVSSNPKDNVVIGYDIEAKDDKGIDVKRIDGAIVLVIHTKGDGENVLDVNNTSIGIRVAEATNRLCIGYWNERYWTKLGGRVDVSLDKRDITVRTNVSHLSRYAIVVKDTGGVITNVSPNPFTPAASQWNTITFSFNNEDNENVEIKLWDITGVLVRTITNAPTSSVVWDGRDEYGEIVEAGVYIYQLKVGNAKAGKGTIVVAK